MKSTAKTAILSAAALTLLAAGSASAQTVTVSNGAMRINTSAFATNQQMEIRVGPIAGQVRLSGVIGAPSTTYNGITSIDLTTGPRDDYVEFRIFTANAPRIRATTGLGNSDVKVLYNLPSSVALASSTVAIIGGPGNDKVFFGVHSFARNFYANWNTQQGIGDNETIASIDSPESSQVMSVAFNAVGGSGKDKHEVEVKSRAASIVLNTRSTTGANNDSSIVKVDTSGAGTLSATTYASLGDGVDVFELTNISRGGPASFYGNLSAGARNDVIKFTSEASGQIFTTFNGSLGNDEIDFFAKGVINGTPRLIGEAGNDKLKLVVDGPRVASPLINGGPGYDIAQGFGTIINCEEVN
jgi:hypothetical protein